MRKAGSPDARMPGLPEPHSVDPRASGLRASGLRASGRYAINASFGRFTVVAGTESRMTSSNAA